MSAVAWLAILLAVGWIIAATALLIAVLAIRKQVKNPGAAFGGLGLPDLAPEVSEEGEGPSGPPPGTAWPPP